MKLLLKICVAVCAVIAVALIGLSYKLPRQAFVSQSIELDAAPDKVFPYLNNPTDWPRWSPWNKTYDPSVIYLYGGPLTGTGARQSWNGDKTGNWQMVFTNASAPDSLTYDLKEAGKATVTKGVFILELTATGTKLTWQQTTPVEDTMLELYKAAWQNYKTEQQVQQGLQNLKALVSDTKQNTAKR